MGAGTWALVDDNAKAEAAVGLSGGAVSSALGVAAFVNAPRPIVFLHARNLLQPIAEKADPAHLYPTFVFRMLEWPVSERARAPGLILLRRLHAILLRAAPDAAAVVVACVVGVA